MFGSLSNIRMLKNSLNKSGQQLFVVKKPVFFILDAFKYSYFPNENLRNRSL